MIFDKRNNTVYNFTYVVFISGLQRGIKRTICWKRGDCRVTGMSWWWRRCVSPLRDNGECLKGLCNWQSLWLSPKTFTKQFWNVFNRYFFCILCLIYNQVNLDYVTLASGLWLDSWCHIDKLILNISSLSTFSSLDLISSLRSCLINSTLTDW